MTVPADIRRWDYDGTGATDTYPFTRKITAATDLVLTQRTTATGAEVTLAYPADYSVTGVGLAAGGNVVLAAGNLASGIHLTIQIVFPLTQQSDFANQGGFFPETHEDAFDKAAGIDQQQQEHLDRTVRFSPGVDPTGHSFEIPYGSEGKFLAVNANGDIAASVGTGADVGLREDLADDTNGAGNGNQLVAIPQTDNEVTGSVTIIVKHRAPGDIRRYGGIEDGSTPVDTAFARAYAAIKSGASGEIYLPCETGDGYYVQSGLGINTTGSNNRNVVVRGDNGAGFGLGTIHGTRLITDQAIDILTLGASGTTIWGGSRVEGVGFEDVSAGHNQVTAGIKVQRMNLAQIINCDFNRIEAGAGILGTGAGGNPQYATVRDCRWWRTLYGVQGATTCVDWTIWGGTYWGVTAGDAMLAGSIGFDLQGTAKMFGTHVQYCYDGIKLTNAPVSKLVGVVLENAGGIGGTNGIWIVSGDGCHILGADIVNWGTYRARIDAGVDRTVLMFDDTASGAAILDNGTDTLIVDMDPARTSKFPQNLAISGPAGLTNAAVDSATTAELEAVGNAINTANKRAGKLVLNTTTNVLLHAGGAAAADHWYSVAGVDTHTPV